MPIQRTGSGKLKPTELVRLGGSGARGIAPWCDVDWASDKPDCGVIVAHGLDVKQAQAGEAMVKGLYQASVHLDEKLVAIVQVLVED